MNMMKRIGFQAGRLLLVLLLVSIMVFLALRLTPGDPALLLLGSQAGRPDAAVTLAALRESMGLDQPWPVQYWLWLSDILQGNLGVSNRNGVAVVELIAGSIPSTLWLIALSVVVSVPVSIVLGILAASRSNGILDRVVRAVTTVSIALPPVWSGLLLIIAFSVTLRLLPSGGYVDPSTDVVEFVRHMIMPVATLSVFLTGVLTRFVYAEASDVLRQDYMRTSLAMGISPTRRLFRYAAKNAVLPMITIVGVQIGALVGGAVLIEAVFGLGGLGQLLLSSVLNRDYQVVQSAVLLTTAVVLVVAYLADIAYRLVDPRIAR